MFLKVGKDLFGVNLWSAKCFIRDFVEIQRKRGCKLSRRGISEIDPNGFAHLVNASSLAISDLENRLQPKAKQLEVLHNCSAPSIEPSHKA